MKESQIAGFWFTLLLQIFYQKCFGWKYIQISLGVMDITDMLVLKRGSWSFLKKINNDKKQLLSHILKFEKKVINIF